MWEGLPGGQRRWISMVLRKQLCWESYFYCKGKTPVVSELWGAGNTTTLGEILSISTKRLKGYCQHTLGEILREIAKDSTKNAARHVNK
jgi:hypothetical protein